MDGENQNFGVWKAGTYLARRFDSIDHRQRVIDDCDVGLVAERLGDGVLAIFSLRDDLLPLPRFEDRAQAQADHFVVVRDQNPGHKYPFPTPPPTRLDLSSVN